MSTSTPTNKECCPRCKEKPILNVYQFPDAVCMNTACPCHSDKGEKSKEKCGYGCGRDWNEQGDFSNCPSAYHVVPELERPTDQERYETGQAIKQAMNRSNDTAPTQPESKGWEERFDELWESEKHDDGFNDPYSMLDKKSLKEFIRLEIEQERERIHGWKMIDEIYQKGRLDVIAELTEKLPPINNRIKEEDLESYRMSDNSGDVESVASQDSWNAYHKQVLDLLTHMRNR